MRLSDFVGRSSSQVPGNAAGAVGSGGEGTASVPLAGFPGLVEISVLAARTARMLEQQVGGDMSCVTILEPDGLLAVRAARGDLSENVTGLRIPVGSGIGGLAVSEGRPVSVVDYSTIDAAQDFVDIMVFQEGIRSAVGVPLIVEKRAIGVLFLGRRDRAPFEEKDIHRLQDFAATISPTLSASQHLAHRVEAVRTAERQGLANFLHEEMIPLFFAIGAAARRAQENLPPDAEEASECMASIANLLRSANSLARGQIGSMGELPGEQELILRIQAAADHLMAVASIPVSVGVYGPALAVDRLTADVLTAVVTEALSNVAKHAPDASAVVTLSYGHADAGVTIADDGIGLPEDFLLTSIEEVSGGQHYGLASLAHRVQLLHGDIEVATNEDGGTTVTARVPLSWR